MGIINNIISSGLSHQTLPTGLIKWFITQHIPNFRFKNSNTDSFLIIWK